MESVGYRCERQRSAGAGARHQQPPNSIPPEWPPPLSPGSPFPWSIPCVSGRFAFACPSPATQCLCSPLPLLLALPCTFSVCSCRIICLHFLAVRHGTALACLHCQIPSHTVARELNLSCPIMPSWVLVQAVRLTADSLLPHTGHRCRSSVYGPLVRVPAPAAAPATLLPDPGKKSTLSHAEV